MSEQATPTPGSANAGVIARLGSQRGQLRAEVRTLTTERDTARTELETLRRENGELKVKADTSAGAKRVQELEGQLRDAAHRKVFDRVAAAKGVPGDSLEVLYQLSGYKAEGDQADEAAIGVLIDQQKGKPGVGRLFGDATPTPTPTPSGTGIVKPGPASGSGGRTETPSSAMFAHDDPRLSDAKFVMQNYELVTKAAQERVARGEV
jgi:hypothetical protein